MEPHIDSSASFARAITLPIEYAIALESMWIK